MNILQLAFRSLRGIQALSEDEDTDFYLPGTCHAAQAVNPPGQHTLFRDWSFAEQGGWGAGRLKWPNNIIIFVHFPHVGKKISSCPFKDTKVGKRGTILHPQDTSSPCGFWRGDICKLAHNLSSEDPFL